MNKRRLSAPQVLKRMRSGDLPYQWGFASIAFDDGARVAPATMTKLVKQGLVNQPATTSVHSPFTLAEVTR